MAAAARESPTVSLRSLLSRTRRISGPAARFFGFAALSVESTHKNTLGQGVINVYLWIGFNHYISPFCPLRRRR
ncbi:hypothetical protein DSO57_1036506 [Entomophthora muscae]|uniref:Uncharacterized protein n=1 Tax=Entomophthora muscae TaxID=34485 RepID=A0ACC2U8L9_9FUNG|nr:hypothetical protein DSO57_1036506 [Entomophthora muscae]